MSLHKRRGEFRSKGVKDPRQRIVNDVWEQFTEGERNEMFNRAAMAVAFHRPPRRWFFVFAVAMPNPHVIGE